MRYSWRCLPTFNPASTPTISWLPSASLPGVVPLSQRTNSNQSKHSPQVCRGAVVRHQPSCRVDILDAAAPSVNVACATLNACNPSILSRIDSLAEPVPEHPGPPSLRQTANRILFENSPSKWSKHHDEVAVDHLWLVLIWRFRCWHRSTAPFGPPEMVLHGCICLAAQPGGASLHDVHDKRIGELPLPSMGRLSCSEQILSSKRTTVAKQHTTRLGRTILGVVTYNGFDNIHGIQIEPIISKRTPTTSIVKTKICHLNLLQSYERLRISSLFACSHPLRVSIPSLEAASQGHRLKQPLFVSDLKFLRPQHRQPLLRHKRTDHICHSAPQFQHMRRQVTRYA